MFISSKRALTATAALGALVLSGCGGSSSGGEGGRALRVAVVPGPQSIPINIAEDQGCFSDNDVELDLTEGIEIAAWQSAVGQQFDIVYTNNAVYVPSVDKGLKNTLINNAITNESEFVKEDGPSVTLASKEPLKDLSDLRGAKIGMPTIAGLFAESVKYLLADAGLDPSDYQLVAMPYANHLDNLKSGNVDAVMTGNPYDQQLQRGGMSLWDKDVVIEANKGVSDGKVDTSSASLFAGNSDWVEKNQELVEIWLDCYKQGTDYIEENEEEARKVLQEVTKMPDEVVADARLTNYTLEVPQPEIEATWNILKANGTQKKDFPKDKVKIYESK